MATQSAPDQGELHAAALMPGDDVQPLTPSRMSQRHGKEGLQTPSKDLLTSPSLSCGSSYSHGFDRGKEDSLQLKEETSISKSKSETKLFNGSDKDISAAGKLAKKESLKVQKKNYREEKKRATKELLSTITDPSVIVMADWLKIRGTLKSWTKLWCVLKPGVLLIYKTHKNGQWVGTVLLNACELIERPSKKDGFCFKLFHPLEQSIWAVKTVRTCNMNEGATVVFSKEAEWIRFERAVPAKAFEDNKMAAAVPL
ncbi:hypothetical protein GJAV_G00157880 [Gymnothorax javanicus]|nr:hypothetical protein GJAV_G00157880 [Gymnothorax javanicus]